MLNFWTHKGWIGAPKGGALKGGAPEGWGGPKFRAFFFPFPATIFFLLSLSLGVFYVEFGGV